ncbi:MDR family MFS transporter [Microlunatus panaciterrae]|uniref:EmrB/QacA subfamily drug resistance transporter n=1 Tax=Microlunatus panaciterrae TaxID=400768 RepID=A0ABS2RJD1_9ACTN|nr:DHA2 family efflux MFS transporter permease subunit [Microlunatus panaciterrae]MBM7798607.1 EmrB/QacA subfamily drug resistance transporter [Microlunatus panaciterrae]
MSGVNQKVAVAVVYVSGLFMNIMDMTIVNVALPQIASVLQVSRADIGTISIAYLVSLAVAIPASGWMGDRFGHRQVLLVAIVLFTIASGLCGSAQSLEQLVGFRVLQGLAGGMMTPVGMALLMRTFPPAERVRAASILTIPTALAPALGPVLGGLLVTTLSWRWVFWVNLPIGLLAVAFGLIFLRRRPLDHAGRFDLLGFVLSGVGFGGLMFGISEGASMGWTSPQIVVALVAGVLLVTVLVFHQLRVREPLLGLRIFTNRLFAFTSTTMFLASAGFLGSLFVAALFFQLGLRLDALQAGLLIFPEAIGVMTGAQVVSRVLYPRLGPRWTIFVGLIGSAAMMNLMWTVTDSDQAWQTRLIMFALGFFQSHNIVSSQAAAFAQISHQDMGRATALLNAGRQLGSAVGVATLATVMAALAAPAQPDAGPGLLGFHLAFTVASVFSLVGLVTVLQIDNADAAETVRGGKSPAAATRS